MLRLLPMLAVITLAASAFADSPAAIADPGHERAHRSFESFAKQWMRKVQAQETRHRAEPSVQPGASQPLVTYRGFGDDFSVELRPTGHAAAPYVGLLRYTEHVYSCRDAGAKDCSVASSMPVTEIFRYQNGRWSY